MALRLGNTGLMMQKMKLKLEQGFLQSDRTITGIRNLNVTTSKGLVPVSSFIQVVPKENRQTVNRKNGKFFQEVGAGTLDESQVSNKVSELK